MVDRAEIQRYLLDNSSVVRLGTTATQKKLFFNLRRVKAELGQFDDDNLSNEAVTSIAERLGVHADEVIMMNGRLSRKDYSLNAAGAQEGETTWQDTLVDESVDMEGDLVEFDELRQQRALLHQRLGELGGRERDILVRRRLTDDVKRWRNWVRNTAFHTSGFVRSKWPRSTSSRKPSCTRKFKALSKVADHSATSCSSDKASANNERIVKCPSRNFLQRKTHRPKPSLTTRPTIKSKAAPVTDQPAQQPDKTPGEVTPAASREIRAEGIVLLRHLSTCCKHRQPEGVR